MGKIRFSLRFFKLGIPCEPYEAEEDTKNKVLELLCLYGAMRMGTSLEMDERAYYGFVKELPEHVRAEREELDNEC